LNQPNWNSGKNTKKTPSIIRKKDAYMVNWCQPSQ
jgi:hypothetical protein